MTMKSLRTVNPDREPFTANSSGNTSATLSSLICRLKLPDPLTAPEAMVTSNGVTAAKSEASALPGPPVPCRETLTAREADRADEPLGRDAVTAAVLVVPSAAVFWFPSSSGSRSTRTYIVVGLSLSSMVTAAGLMV